MGSLLSTNTNSTNTNSTNTNSTYVNNKKSCPEYIQQNKYDNVINDTLDWNNYKKKNIHRHLIITY